MIYPRTFEQKLGFDKIRELLKDFCQGEIGKEYVDKIRFTPKAHVLDKLTGQVEEFIRLEADGETFPSSNFTDFRAGLRKVEIDGAFLMPAEFFQLKGALSTLSQCHNILVKLDVEEYPHLVGFSEQLELDFSILSRIEAVIDERGQVRDNASPMLADIRKMMISERSRLRNKIDSVLVRLKKDGMSKDDVNPTVRDGRLVLPVFAEYKRKVKGFIHDTSGTGQTVYIEPEEVLNMNNEIKQLEAEEKQEIARILIALTNYLRPSIDLLKSSNLFLGKIDLIRAKARLARQLEAIKPSFRDEPYIDWYRASHPLLKLSHDKSGKGIVTQNFKLNDEQRILLISGPNAGGKSVALKTVGLLQYMFQCGLLVPVLESSEFGVFEKVFVDIGDEQSIENDLSTYSSHLTYMKYFTKNAHEKTLFLIDEFGTGTEPELGAAIAEAILDRLNERCAYGVITTHYANLKFYAGRTEGVVNAAMRYDVKNLNPLYELEIGHPGSSFALEIAQKIGLPDFIVNKARNIVGKKKINMEELLKQLEEDKKKLRMQKIEMEEKERALEKTLQQYEILKKFQEDNKRKLVNDAKLKAQQIIAGANQKIEETIASIRSSQADKEKTKESRNELQELKKELAVDPAELAVDELSNDIELETGSDIVVGDFVMIRGQQAFGEVLEVGKKDFTVSMGGLKTTIKKNRVDKISKKSARKLTRKESKSGSGVSYHSAASNVSRRLETFKHSIDFRGKRVEEIASELNEFIDGAVLVGARSVSILHGKGGGVLREMIRRQLKGFPEVKSFGDEHEDRGGAGITVVTLF